MSRGTVGQCGTLFGRCSSRDECYGQLLRFGPVQRFRFPHDPSSSSITCRMTSCIRSTTPNRAGAQADTFKHTLVHLRITGIVHRTVFPEYTTRACVTRCYFGLKSHLPQRFRQAPLPDPSLHLRRTLAPNLEASSFQPPHPTIHVKRCSRMSMAPAQARYETAAFDTSSACLGVTRGRN